MERVAQNWDGVFPAHAGVILVSAQPYQVSGSFSRTRGGDPWVILAGDTGRVFFPHTRGWSWSVQMDQKACWVFPAHAGVILSKESRSVFVRRFSRTRGGDPTKYETPDFI